MLELAGHLGWLAYHTHDSRRSTPGFPDLVLVRASTCELIFAELKTETGRVSAAQQRWLDALATTGVAGVHIWRPSMMGEIAELLARPRDLIRHESRRDDA